MVRIMLAVMSYFAVAAFNERAKTNVSPILNAILTLIFGIYGLLGVAFYLFCKEQNMRRKR